MRRYLVFGLWCFVSRICNAFSVTSPSPPVKKQIPITVISGFLGSGKTTLVQTLLENKEGLKIAVIVNDVAAVNIDSKLVAENSNADGMVKLENGCACCSLSEELLGSVSELVTMSDLRCECCESDGFDHIVVELSGVSDPKGVRSQFQEAMFYGMPLMERVRLDTMVTVIDCSVFLKHLQSTKTANRTDTPELFYREGEEIPEQREMEDWMEDMPPLLLEALLAGDEAVATNLPIHENKDAVAELLVSQTETADIVLLNKVDLVDESKDLTTIDQIVKALNSKADVKKTTYGKVPLKQILAVKGGKGVAEAGVVDDHRDAIEAAEQAIVLDDTGHSSSHSHSSHDHVHSEAIEDTTDDSHSHSHSHSAETAATDKAHSHSAHSHEHTELSTDNGDANHATTAREKSHSHSAHDHDHTAQSGDDEDANHAHSHSHSHSHSAHDHDHAAGTGEDTGHSHTHSHAEVCDDPDCTDTSHSHSHSHTHMDDLGIGSFVYRARKPFHPQRLIAFLRHMPISRGLPEKTEDEPTLEVSQEAEQALRRVVRSKGFVWLGDSNVAANYWSHSGTAFEMQCLGRWWSTLSRAEWPPEAVATILADFDDHKHEEGSDDSVGDRRQEVVFIGPGLLSLDRQKDIVLCLDQCLLKEEEWEEYRAKRNDEASLRTAFVTSIESKMLTY